MRRVDGERVPGGGVKLTFRGTEMLAAFSDVVGASPQNLRVPMKPRGPSGCRRMEAPCPDRC